MRQRWNVGDTVVRREVKGLSPLDDGDRSAPWFDRAWIEMPMRVVEDDGDDLALFVASGTAFTFPDGVWEAGKEHPWKANGAWRGHGCLMVQDPTEHHSIWHFWAGPDRAFACWYVNLQTALRIDGDQIDTQDLELDLLVWPDGTWEFKDWDLLDLRVQQGTYTTELAAWIRSYGTELGDRLDREGPWWDTGWTSWEPPTGWEPDVLLDWPAD